jgi:YbbR domain-containing protein
MRRGGLLELWEAATERAIAPRSRTFGVTRITLRQYFADLLSPGSVVRLIVAFLLATLLWLYVNSRNNTNIALTYPQAIAITPENVPPGLTVRNLLPPVHVSIRLGPQGLAVLPSSFVAAVDLSSYGPGIHRHVPVHLSADPSISVVSYTPRTVTVVLDRLVKHTVPVQVRVISPPPVGYELKSKTPTVSPSSITVEGPAALVQQVSQAAVFVDLGDARSSINQAYTPVLQNAQGTTLASHLSVTPPQVIVHVAVQQLASYKMLPIVPTISGQPAPGFGTTAILVKPSDLTVYGSPHALNVLNSLNTAPVHVGGLGAGRHTFVVGLQLPDGVSTYRRRVHVIVMVGPVPGTESIPVAVVPINVVTGAMVTAKPGAVLVTISGPAPQLASAGAQVRATVNLKGVGPGTHTVKPQLRVPRGFMIQSWSPHAVTVTVRRVGT